MSVGYHPDVHDRDVMVDGRWPTKTQARRRPEFDVAFNANGFLFKQFLRLSREKSRSSRPGVYDSMVRRYSFFNCRGKASVCMNRPRIVSDIIWHEPRGGPTNKQMLWLPDRNGLITTKVLLSANPL
jgi:hypothetical protein